MNPWLKELLELLGQKHDTECAYGDECATRDRHISNVYFPQACKKFFKKNPEAQREIIEQAQERLAKGDQA